MHNHNIRKFKQAQIDKVASEFKEGLTALEKYPLSVTFFGSARFKPDHPSYKQAESIAYRIVKETKYAIVTGGGPGIMEAANKGAHDANGKSVGMTIALPQEQKNNLYLDKEVHFQYFFTRKAILNFSAEAYIFFPGGFGTLDELFTVLTLIQTKKIPQIPVILMGVEFWRPLKHVITQVLRDQYETISKEDVEIFRITDDEEEVLNTIRNAPVNGWWAQVD